MMTIEKAIRLAQKWAEGGVCTLREGEAQEYHKLCLNSLLERKERSNGCYRCKTPNIEHFGMDAGINGSRSIYRAFFCPMCGRRLEETQN